MGLSTAPAGPDDTATEIQRKSVRGWSVTLGTQAANVLLQLASTIVLARLLEPGELGIVAMVTALTALAALFRDFGLSSATIQRIELSQVQLSTLFWINVATGALLTVVVAAASPLIAAFYQRPELAAVALASGFTFLIGGVGLQQRALLTRQMQFARIAAATLGGAATGLIVTVLLALQSLSYWSLVVGNLSGALVSTLIIWRVSRWRPGRPAWRSGLRPILKFGANVTGFEVVNYLHRNLDNILIGRYCGADTLGVYDRAYQLLMLPIQALRAPIFAVAFPALSRLQARPEEFRVYYRTLLTLLAFLTMPLTSFLFASAEPLIRLALGPRWLGVVDLFLPLAVAGFILPISGTRGIIFLSLGKGSDYFVHGLVKAVILSACFLVAIRWGAPGIAISYAVGTYLTQVFAIPYTVRKTFITTGDLLGPALVPAGISILAGATTIFVAHHHVITSALAAVLRDLVVFSTTFAIFTGCIPSARSSLSAAWRTILRHRLQPKSDA